MQAWGVIATRWLFRTNREIERRSAQSRNCKRYALVLKTTLRTKTPPPDAEEVGPPLADRVEGTKIASNGTLTQEQDKDCRQERVTWIDVSFEVFWRSLLHVFSKRLVAYPNTRPTSHWP